LVVVGANEVAEFALGEGGLADFVPKFLFRPGGGAAGVILGGEKREGGFLSEIKAADEGYCCGKRGIVPTGSRDGWGHLGKVEGGTVAEVHERLSMIEDDAAHFC
jgi:hypothetical protein